MSRWKDSPAHVQEWRDKAQENREEAARFREEGDLMGADKLDWYAEQCSILADDMTERPAKP